MVSYTGWTSTRIRVRSKLFAFMYSSNVSHAHALYSFIPHHTSYHPLHSCIPIISFHPDTNVNDIAFNPVIKIPSDQPIDHFHPVQALSRLKK